jgi:hypothetical protein
MGGICPPLANQPTSNRSITTESDEPIDSACALPCSTTSAGKLIVSLRFMRAIAFPFGNVGRPAFASRPNGSLMLLGQTALAALFLYGFRVSTATLAPHAPIELVFLAGANHLIARADGDGMLSGLVVHLPSY